MSGHRLLRRRRRRLRCDNLGHGPIMVIRREHSAMIDQIFVGIANFSYTFAFDAAVNFKI